ncbi:MAG TPA: hypothetical protein VMD77_01450 [Candidatus Baltobacteraceae bacterium]|nr:hypothetical protein [Candidatus Baltobacteraceae bacterium]
MRAFWLCIVALGLAVSPAMAGTGAGGDNDSAGNGATNTAAKADPAPAASSPSSLEIENELQQLRELLQTQSKELQDQDEQIKQQKVQMQELQDQLTTPGPTADSVAASVTSSINAPIGTAGVIGNSSSANSRGDAAQTGEPVSLSFKGITLTPGGFMAAETAWRGKALSADVNTPFNSIPLPGSSANNISEFNASGRQSRISMLVQGKLDNVAIGGYYETDFLSAGTTSNYNQSNSFTLRQRQFWAQAKFNNGFTFTGGQMWSLVTETGHAMDNRTELTPLTIDAQYSVGFSWARQYGARFTQSLFADKLTLGFSIENAEATPITVHGNPTGTSTSGAVTVDCPISSSCLTGTTTVGGTTTTFTNYLLGQAGAGGGLLNGLANFTYNKTPDFVVKAVLEPGFGHYEVYGLVSTFRDRVFPCAATAATDTCGGITGPSVTGAFNDSRTGGGIGASARWHLFAKHLDLGIKGMGGNGVGRYGSAQLPDATVRPDGTLALLHNYMGLGTIQIYPTPKLDIYLNAGDEYAARAQYIKSGTTPNEGYGAIGFSNAGCWTETLPTTTTPVGTTAGSGFVPGGLSSCTGDTRNIIEGTGGFWYRFYKGSRGTVQYGMQFSYIVRNTWSGVGSVAHPSGSPTANEPMVFTSFRYYLP